jgi:hypothetical protein
MTQKRDFWTKITTGGKRDGHLVIKLKENTFDLRCWFGKKSSCLESMLANFNFFVFPIFAIKL